MRRFVLALVAVVVLLGYPASRAATAATVSLPGPVVAVFPGQGYAGQLVDLSTAGWFTSVPASPPRSAGSGQGSTAPIPRSHRPARRWSARPLQVASGPIAHIFFDSISLGYTTMTLCNQAPYQQYQQSFGFGSICTGTTFTEAVPSEAQPGGHVFTVCQGVNSSACASAPFTVLPPQATTQPPTTTGGIGGPEPAPGQPNPVGPGTVPTPIAGGIHDGDLNTSYESDPGQNRNVTVSFSLGCDTLWQLTDIVIDPAAVAPSSDSADDLKDFTVLVSTTGTAPSDFHPILSGTTAQQASLQLFHLSTPVNARYVELLALNNYGGDRIAVTEFEAYGIPPGTTEGQTASTTAKRTALMSRRILATRHAHFFRDDSSLASVAAIINGLSVAPPATHASAGHVKQDLFQQYELQTARSQKATFKFVDGTIVHMNQRTDAVLQNPHITRVRGGEVQEIVQPGTNHQVQTDAAVASAVGTNFLVIVTGTTTQVIVIEGAVLVSNDQGSVLVKTGQETTVLPGQAPGPIVEVRNVSSYADWTDGLPHPVMPMNVALDANCGVVLGAGTAATTTTTP